MSTTACRLNSRVVSCLAGIVAVLAAATVVRAQDPAVARFTAFAVALGAPVGAGTATVDMTITRWSTEAEVRQLVDALVEGGDAFRKLLPEMPRVGTVRSPDSLGYPLHFATRTTGTDGSERIVLITDRPMSYFEASRRPPVSEYPFVVIELVLKDGEGEGTLSGASRITADGLTRTIRTEDFAIQPVMLRSVRRVSG